MVIDDGQYLLPIQFYMPLVKSRAKESVRGEPLWMVEGTAATDKIDQQKEKLILSGMDYSPLIKSGVINWDHGSGPEDILGEPLEAKIIEKSSKPSIFYTRGWLYKHQPRSQSVWNHLQALEKGEQPITRKFGWSVQGGVLERRGQDLVKSVVRHLALTHQPVNADTWAKCMSTLVKSLNTAVATNRNPVSDLIFSPCQSDCLNKSTGEFTNGYHGMLNHLAICKNVPIPEARELVMLLVKNGGQL